LFKSPPDFKNFVARKGDLKGCLLGINKEIIEKRIGGRKRENRDFKI
jgi:hypothetical protein